MDWPTPSKVETPVIWKTLFLVLFLSGAGPALASADLDSHIRAAAHRFRIDPLLVKAIVEVESRADRLAVSPKGAQGLMQVMPRTAEQLGIANPHHSLSNLMGACEYLRTLLNRFSFDLVKTLAAYNAGPTNVDRYGGIPPFRETRHYVRKVLAAYERLKKE